MTAYIQTASGGKIDLLNPDPNDINIDDIAHALSYICRYNGHVERFYSVAEHSVHVSYCVNQEYALQALMHDAAEAYLGDLPGPFKKHVPDFCIYEANLHNAICTKFGINTTIPDEVKRADMLILNDERDQCLNPALDDKLWSYLPQDRIGVKLSCFWPETAKQLFLDRFGELRGYL